MEETNTNTVEKQARKGQFRKGDPRINRKGRPKSFDQLRALAQQISHEPIKDGASMTAAEAILRKLAFENPTRFLEIAYGKVPDKLEVTTHDIDREIERELARVAARGKTKDAVEVADSDSSDGVA